MAGTRQEGRPIDGGLWRRGLPSFNIPLIRAALQSRVVAAALLVNGAINKQPVPSTTAVMAAATRSQNVLRLRAATCNSRRTTGRMLISHR